jgi:enterochelin esterase-like enzyme
MKKIWLFLFFLPASVVVLAQTNKEIYNTGRSMSAGMFLDELQKDAAISNEDLRNTCLNELWDTLIARKQIPYESGDTVIFLYKGEAKAVSWAGDFNGWSPVAKGYAGNKAGLSNIWYMLRQFPVDARLDYKIVVDGNWIVDPANTHVQMSGMGPNSELRMPGYLFPEITLPDPNAMHGRLSDNFILHSNRKNLGYVVQYRVYTPAGYNRLSNLPVVYVTDGHEYADGEKGAMINVLDNLLFRNIIRPVIAVFIDPRDPGNLADNRRMKEYTGNIRFANFVADELIPVIDSMCKTNPKADYRAIMGTSLGGWNAAYFGITRPDKFHLLIIHSPAFDDEIMKLYKSTPHLPLKIFMSTGVISDTETRARKMKAILEKKGYSLVYKEVNEGHSWGNWKGLLDDPLINFFQYKEVIINKRSDKDHGNK